MDLERFVAELRAWGPGERAIAGLAIVGGHARGAAAPGAPVELVIFVEDAGASDLDLAWMSRFGVVRRADVRGRGQPVEPAAVEILLAPARWLEAEPYDDAARALLEGGARVVHDPRVLVRRLAIAARPDAPERHVVTSACGRYERVAWFAPAAADEPRRLAVFLDSEYYLHDIDCLPVLRASLGAGGLPAMSCAFVSCGDHVARHEDLFCHPAYARFLAEDVVAWARRRDSRIAEHDHLIVGVSLSGLMAAYVALHHPGVFSSALCQSGSFWWLADHPRAWPATAARLWLSVGDEETATNVAHVTHLPGGLLQRVSQLDGVDAAARAFAACGATVHAPRFAGGHAVAPWRADLAPALRWLLGPAG